MTKEYALHLLNQLSIGASVDAKLIILQYELAQALDLAIKALEQQPCDDCISREALDNAISELTYWHPTTDGGLEVGGAFDNTVYKVEDVWRLAGVLPSVTPVISKMEQVEDCISREAVEDYIAKLMSVYLYDEERTG